MLSDPYGNTRQQHQHIVLILVLLDDALRHRNKANV